jgi:hypothetical protein
MKKAICLLTKSPNEIWLEFLNRFSNYDIFLIIDDNSQTYNTTYENIRLIQIENENCYKNEYTNCISAVEFPEVTAWDKALYLMNEIEMQYEHVWFIEDDVFLFDESALLNIDAAYESSDLLSAFHHINRETDTNSWNNWWNHWVNIVHKLELPWAHSMVCACRLSRTMLDEVVKYKNKKGALCFIEAMFNTIALHKGLIVDNPPELSTIHWRANWDINEINPTNLYHPMKNISEHKIIRDKCSL